MSFTRFLTSRTFLINLAIAVVLLAVIVFATMKGLEKYTRHGQSYPVPEFTGMMPAEAQNIARQQNMKVEIVDSLFLNDMEPGVVVDQIPRPGHGVKQNRTIFITINSTQPEMVTLPQLTDISFRQAQVLIENSGLQMGDISYRPSEFDNLVLKVQMNSRDLKPGRQLPKGTRIDLIVGRQAGNQTTFLPDLTGLTVDEAIGSLSAHMLNAGVIIYDNSVISAEDSVQAKIWQQRPDPRMTQNVLIGSSVDLWVTIELPETEEEETPDFF